MKKPFTQLAIFILLICSTAVFAQSTPCSGSLTNPRVNLPACDQSIVTYFNKGEYSPISVVQGVTYYFLTGGSSSGATRDVRLYARENSTSGPVVFNINDNATSSEYRAGEQITNVTATGGPRESFNWVASFTGDLWVSHHQYNCAWDPTSASIQYREVNTIDLSANDESLMNLCDTSERLLTSNLTTGSWSWSNSNVVDTVINDVVSIKAAGNASIRYSLGGLCSRSVDFEVVDTRLDSLSLVPDNADSSMIRLIGGTADSVSWYSSDDGSAFSMIGMDDTTLSVECGKYYYAVVDSYGCISLSDTFWKRCPDTISSSVSMVSTLDGFSVYPNPSKAEVNLTTGAYASNLIILNSTGAVIQEERLEPNARKQIRDLASGIYFFLLVNENARMTKRVMILGE